MLHALTWLLAIELLGALTFPLTFLLLHRLPDRGFSVTRPVALLLVSYLLWVATGEGAYLEQSRRMAGEFREHAPAALRDGLLEAVPLLQAIDAAE